MAREREVVVGRVGRVLLTPGGSGGETLNPARLHEGSGGPGAYSASAARPGEGVGSGSSWPPGLLGDLEASFSPERMSRYVAAAGGDRERAVALYAWNTVVSGAFYEPLQGLEIALRHALHGQLTRCYGEAWYDNPEAGTRHRDARADRRGADQARARRPGADAVAGGGRTHVRLLGGVAARRPPPRPGGPPGGLRADAVAAGATAARFLTGRN